MSKMTNVHADKQMDVEEKTVKLCKKKVVLEAITIIKKLTEKFFDGENKKQPLLDQVEDNPVFLQVTMKKIPPKKMVSRIKVPLPHTIVTDATEICLFTGDLDKRNKKAEVEPDVLHYKELLKKQGITQITEVIPLRQLRTEYKVYEAKRQLAAAYDGFLCDKKIAQCLPKLLGKAFIQKRKFPTQINMETSNLKRQIEKALSETVFSLNCRGNSCASEVARLSMENSKIADNVLACVECLVKEIPGKQNNIFGIYMKTAKSAAIPIFISFGNPNEVKMEKPCTYEKVDLEELSTLPNAKVKVFSDGKITVKKTRAVSDDESDKDEVNETKARRGKKKRKHETVNEDKSVSSTEMINEVSQPKIKVKAETNSRKTEPRRKRKASFKNKDPECIQSEELEDSNEETACLKHEFEVKDTENTNISKANVTSKRKVNIKEEVHESEPKSTKKRKSASALEKDINTSKTQLKVKKRKTGDFDSKEAVPIKVRDEPKMKNTRKNHGLRKNKKAK